jgi:hypothetical protein
MLTNKTKTKRLTWGALFKWVFRDTLDESYTSEGRSRFYDLIAREFFHRDRLGQYITDKILSLYQGRQPFICERAAGSGIITERLYAAGLRRIHATDLSESQLLVLKEKMPDITIAVENFNEDMAGIDDGSVDVIFQTGATRFMSPQGQRHYIHEAARTLHEGGHVLWPVMWAEIPLSWGRSGWRGPRMTSWGIARLLEKSGLEIVESPLVIHGRLCLLTTTFIVARKQAIPIRRTWAGTMWQLLKTKGWVYLKALTD